MWGSEADKMAFAACYPYFYGSASERDPAKGIRKVRKLADQGYVPAVFALGYAYFTGSGVRRDWNGAYTLILLAAGEDYPSAACETGNFHAIVRPKHSACTHDPAEAVRWWTQAGDKGNPGALCNLAGALLSGLGTPINPEEAYVRAALAAHCTEIRLRPAEVHRDQAARLLDSDALDRAVERFGQLRSTLPLPWSEHSTYWKTLFEKYQDD